MSQDENLVLVTFAVKEEAASFVRAIKDHPHIRVLVTGMGRRNAREAVERFLSQSSPHWVVTAGFAGALDPRLSPGTVLCSSVNAPELEQALVTAGARRARFTCVQRVAITAGEKAKLREQTGADAVEMESGIIQEICCDAEIPCVTVRAISDGASEDLPLDFNALLTPDFRLDYPKLARALLAAPHRIPALLRFQRRTSFAARKLSDALLAIIRR